MKNTRLKYSVIFSGLFLIFSSLLFCQNSENTNSTISAATETGEQNKSWQQNQQEAADKPVHFNQWELILYRPFEPGSTDINDLRCFIKMEDAETGEDVTYTKVKAKYEWIADTKTQKMSPEPEFFDLFRPGRIMTLYDFRKKYYIDGGMAVHLNLKPGKYRISVYTPEQTKKDWETNSEYHCEGNWTSNVFEYNTENPAKVIFIKALHNENGFFSGFWNIDYRR